MARTLRDLEPLADPEWGESALARPLTVLAGVGPKRAEPLARRGLHAVSDLLFHLPTRYDDRRSLAAVGDLRVGDHATFVAKVLVCDFVRGRGYRRIFQAVVGDETGTVQLKWFRGGESIRSIVRRDAFLLVTGDVKRYRFQKELVHPEVLVVDGAESAERRIVADYPTPEGLHPRTLRRLVETAVGEYGDLLTDHLPDALVRERNLPAAAEALGRLHEPGDEDDLEALRERASPAIERLVLEELYLLEVGLALRRSRQQAEPGLPLAGDGPRTSAAPEGLPFRLTAAQRRAWQEIRDDLTRPHPMNRLLQGDVGSGKTAVAFLSAVQTAENGAQSALMAPTELLAEQHARTLANLVSGGGPATALRIETLTASVPRPRAQSIRAALVAGEVDLVIGTHALIQSDVEFRRLALTIVDEQHRFGVRQRAALTARGAEGRMPHTLVMTATPIPRTLALTVWGDLDLSVIDELPPGRTPVATRLVRSGEGVLDTLRETVGRGDQAYVVYPLVEESERIDLRSATESTEKLRRALPGVAVDLVHGRLDAEAREAAMRRFVNGETRVLVSTTVIEVGVDVAGATLMIVEHAERFGLAQLHQLRGRVGRGEKPGACLLVARGSTEDSEARLRAMLETTDGFRIADADLRIRGPGEFLGTRQHGRLPDLRVADLVRDGRLIGVAREAALETVRSDPSLTRHGSLARAVERQWGDRLALVDVG